MWLYDLKLYSGSQIKGKSVCGSLDIYLANKQYPQRFKDQANMSGWYSKSKATEDDLRWAVKIAKEWVWRGADVCPPNSVYCPPQTFSDRVSAVREVGVTEYDAHLLVWDEVWHLFELNCERKSLHPYEVHFLRQGTEKVKILSRWSVANFVHQCREKISQTNGSPAPPDMRMAVVLQ